MNRKIKNTIALMLAFLVGLSGLIPVAMSESIEVSDNGSPEEYLFYTFSDQGVIIDYYDGDFSEFSIPDTIGGVPVVEIRAGAFANREGVLRLELPATIQAIAEDAFANSTIVLRVAPDSFAEAYAQQHGIEYRTSASPDTTGDFSAYFGEWKMVYASVGDYAGTPEEMGIEANLRMVEDGWIEIESGGKVERYELNLVGGQLTTYDNGVEIILEMDEQGHLFACADDEYREFVREGSEPERQEEANTGDEEIGTEQHKKEQDSLTFEDTVPLVAERNHMAISAGLYSSAGTTTEGNVVWASSKSNQYHQYKDWEGILQAESCQGQIIALTTEGRILTDGEPFLDCHEEMKDWEEIVQIASAPDGDTMGLKSDGTVVIATRYNYESEVQQWRNVVSIDAGYYSCAALRSDGTVMGTGTRFPKDVESWSEIRQISVSDIGSIIVGLRQDGTIVVSDVLEEDSEGHVKRDLDFRRAESEWKDIIQVAAGQWNIFGLTSEGSVLVAGYEPESFEEVNQWKDVRQIEAGSWHLLGLKDDGTVCAVRPSQPDLKEAKEASMWQNIGPVEMESETTDDVPVDEIQIYPAEQNHGTGDGNAESYIGEWNLKCFADEGSLTSVDSCGVQGSIIICEDRTGMIIQGENTRGFVWTYQDGGIYISERNRLLTIDGQNRLHTGSLVFERKVENNSFVDYYFNGTQSDAAPTPAQTVELVATHTEENTDYSKSDIIVDIDSPEESIRYIQELLSDVGLLKSSDVDGRYGNKVINAVILFQQWVNQSRGSRVLEVSGLCDELTLQYLMYCSDRGFRIDEANTTAVPSKDSTEAPDTVPIIVPFGESYTFDTQITSDGSARLTVDDATYETLSLTLRVDAYKDPSYFEAVYSADYNLQGNEAAIKFDLTLNDYTGTTEIIPQNFLQITCCGEDETITAQSFQLMDSEIGGRTNISITSNVTSTLYKRYDYSADQGDMVYMVVTAYNDGKENVFWFEIQNPFAEEDSEVDVMPGLSPEPTMILSTMFSQCKTKGFSVPEPSTNGTAEITNFYVSEPDNRQVVRLDGYGYLNDMNFDGSDASIFVIVTKEDTGKQRAYKPTMEPGVSGVNHSDAICKNAADTDFSTIFSVAEFEDDDYTLGLIIYYKTTNGTAFSYFELDNRFTVINGRVFTAKTDVATGASDGTIDPNVCLTIGSRSEEVRKLQEKLIELGLLQGQPDGRYGKYTANAVMVMQKEFGMEQTGIATASFLERLYSGD